MKKPNQDINSILLANWYLISCKTSDRSVSHEIARKYLTLQIKKALLVKKKSNTKEPFIF